MHCEVCVCVVCVQAICVYWLLRGQDGGKETPPPTSVQVTTPTGCSPSLSMKEMRGSVI